MKTAFILTLLLASFRLGIAQAAPLCSQVLQSESKVISDEAITASIKQMAQLKLDLDQAQARGGQEGISSHFLLSQYPKKYQELVQGLQGHLSEKGIANLIKKEIRQLQKVKVSDRTRTRQNKEVRELIERERSLSFEYELVGQPLNAPRGQVTNSENIYLPEENSIYHFDGSRFERFDFKKGYDEHIHDGVSGGALMNDNKSILMLADEGLRTFDIKSQRLSRPKKVSLPRGSQLPPRVGRLLLNPSESHVILKGWVSWSPIKRNDSEAGPRFSVVDMTTKKQIFVQEDFPKNTQDVAFLNDHQVAVLLENTNLVIMDVATKKRGKIIKLKNLNNKENESQLALSNDGTILTIAHGDGFISLDAKNPSRVIAERMISQRESYPSLIKARGYPQAIIVKDSDNNMRLLNMENLNFEFDFAESTQGGRTVYQAAVSPDGEHILAFYKTGMGSFDRYTHFWKRTPNK